MRSSRIITFRVRIAVLGCISRPLNHEDTVRRSNKINLPDTCHVRRYTRVIFEPLDLKSCEYSRPNHFKRIQVAAAGRLLSRIRIELFTLV
jgi:hypothetical protein